MANTNLISLLPYDTISQSFFYFFSKEFGELKLKEVIEKVEKSGQVRSFLRDSAYKKVRYNSKSFVTVIQTGRRFLLAKAESVSCGAIYLLEKWHTEVGDNLGLSNEKYLKDTFFEILNQCDNFKTHISGNPNFFARYYLFLESALDRPDDIEYNETIENENLEYRREPGKIEQVPTHLQELLLEIPVVEATSNGIVSTIGSFGFYWTAGDNVVDGKKGEHYFLFDDYAVRVNTKLGEKLRSCGEDIDFIFWATFKKGKLNEGIHALSKDCFYLCHPDFDIETKIENSMLNTEEPQSLSIYTEKLFSSYEHDSGSYQAGGIKYCNEHFIPLSSNGKCPTCEENSKKYSSSSDLDDLPF